MESDSNLGPWELYEPHKSPTASKLWHIFICYSQMAASLCVCFPFIVTHLFSRDSDLKKFCLTTENGPGNMETGKPDRSHLERKKTCVKSKAPLNNAVNLVCRMQLKTRFKIRWLVQTHTHTHTHTQFKKQLLLKWSYLTWMYDSHTHKHIRHKHLWQWGSTIICL